MTTILTPYNTKNILITYDELCLIFKKMNINIPPNNIDTYIHSLTHKSYTKTNNYELSKCKNDSEYILGKRDKDILDLFDKHNEKLEFLGDRIIDAVVVEYIYNRYNSTGANEGFMTKLKTRLVKTDTLAIFAKYLELDKYVIISNHMENRCNGRQNNNILENTFEAFIAATFNDYNNTNLKLNNTTIRFGYEICKTVIYHLLNTLIDFEEIVMNDDNYKDIILRYFQQTYHVSPVYKIIKEEGPPHKRTYEIGIYDNCHSLIGVGISNSKKNAEQIASKNALIQLGELKVN